MFYNLIQEDAIHNESILIMCVFAKPSTKHVCHILDSCFLKANDMTHSLSSYLKESK